MNDMNASFLFWCSWISMLILDQDCVGMGICVTLGGKTDAPCFNESNIVRLDFVCLRFNPDPCFWLPYTLYQFARLEMYYVYNFMQHR